MKCGRLGYTSWLWQRVAAIVSLGELVDARQVSPYDSGEEARHIPVRHRWLRDSS